MKIDIIIIDLVLVAMVVVPFLIFINVGKRETKRLKGRFIEETRRCGLHLSNKLHWNSTMIGLDKNQQKLLLVQKRGDIFLVELFDLRGVKQSRITYDFKPIKIQGKVENLLQWVNLELIRFSGENQFLNLFSSDDFIYQDQEIRHAEKLSGLLNQILVLKPKLDKAA